MTLPCFAPVHNSDLGVAYDDESQEAVPESACGESIHVLQHIRGMIKN